MNDPKQEKKEQEWGDRIPEEEEADAALDKPYRDGSAVNECWARDEENV